MTYSTLYALPQTDATEGQASVKEASKQTDEAAPASFGYVVGFLQNGDAIVHGSPSDKVPAGAITYRDGSVPWTWVEVAAEFPEIAENAMPHGFAGEGTEIGCDKLPTFSRIVALKKTVRTAMSEQVEP